MGITLTPLSLETTHTMFLIFTFKKNFNLFPQEPHSCIYPENFVTRFRNHTIRYLKDCVTPIHNHTVGVEAGDHVFTRHFIEHVVC